jgi:hypothetical protein
VVALVVVVGSSEVAGADVVDDIDGDRVAAS